MQPNSVDNFDTLERNIDILSHTTSGFWDVIFASPLTYLGYIFAFMAACAFLVFIRGFLSGIPKVFTMDYHDEHQEHHRVRATWGVMMLVYLFVAWEVVRYVLGGFFTLFGIDA